jgi:hypothetical protein
MTEREIFLDALEQDDLGCGAGFGSPLQLMRNGQGNGTLADSAPKNATVNNRAPTAQPLLVLFLTLPLDVELSLFAPDFRCGLPP